MNDRTCLEKAVKYLGKLLKGQTPKTKNEILEIKSIREHLNGMMYGIKNEL